MKRNRLISMTGALLAAVFSNITSANNEFFCSTQGLVQPNEYNAVFLFDNQQFNSNLSLGGYFQGILDAGGLNGDYTVADVAEPFRVLNRPSITLAPLTTQQVLESKPLAFMYVPKSPLEGTGVCADIEVIHRVFEDTTAGAPLNTYAISIYKQYHSPDNGCFYVHDYWAQMADPTLTLDERRDIVSTFVYGDSSTPGQFLYKGQLFDSLIASNDPIDPFETAFRINRSIDSFVSDQLVVPFETLNVPTVQSGSWTLVDTEYNLGFGPQLGDLIFGVGSPQNLTYDFAFDSLARPIIRFGVDTAYTAPTDERILQLITTVFSGFEGAVIPARSALNSFYCLAEAPPIISAPEPPVTPNFTGLEPVSTQIRLRWNLNARPHFTLTGPDASSVSASEATPFLGIPKTRGWHLGVAMASPFLTDPQTGLLSSAISFEEWDYMDHWHFAEDVSGMVLPLGLGLQFESDGTQWEVGKVELDSDTLPGKSAVVNFSGAFSSAPYIFTTVHHYGRDCETVNARVSNVGASEFTLHYENQNPSGVVSVFNRRDKGSCSGSGVNRGPNGGIEISYLAIAPGAQNGGNGTQASPSIGSITLGGVTRTLELFTQSMGIGSTGGANTVEQRDQVLDMNSWNTRFFLTQADAGINKSNYQQTRVFRWKLTFSGAHRQNQTVGFMRILPSANDPSSHIFGGVQTYNGGASAGALYLRRRDI